MRRPFKRYLNSNLASFKTFKSVLLVQFHITGTVWKCIGVIPFRYLPHITDGTFIVDT